MSSDKPTFAPSSGYASPQRTQQLKKNRQDSANGDLLLRSFSHSVESGVSSELFGRLRDDWHYRAFEIYDY